MFKLYCHALSLALIRALQKKETTGQEISDEFLLVHIQLIEFNSSKKRRKKCVKRYFFYSTNF